MTKKPVEPRNGDAPAWAQRHQLSYLSQSEILEELGPAGLPRAIMLLLGTIAFCAVAWATLATIQQTAKASGQVVPQGPIHLVEHVEGGNVVQVMVREGELVEKGDVLVRLAPTMSGADFQAAEARRIGLALRVERLRAFTDEREPDFGFAPTPFDGMIADQRAILSEQRLAGAQARNVLEHEIEQSRAEIKALSSQAQRLRAELPLIGERRDRQRRLLEESLITRLEYLETEQQLTAKRGDLRVVEAQMEKARGAAESAQAKLAEYAARSRDEALEEIGRAAAELAEVEQNAIRLGDRVRRLDVVAPVRGLVQALEANAVGRVVTPGSLIAEIVPVDDELVVEAKLDPADVGQVRIGDRAMVKFSTYDYSRLGAVDGVVDRVSPTTFEDQDGAIYYKAMIRLMRNYVGPATGQNPIMPGLVADIEVEGKTRTILQYLLHPVFRSLDVAMSEK
ncbi:MAG: HlyD family type I secretion periplasmic adaptor subunit [Alphaproteobacteria bacterium]